MIYTTDPITGERRINPSVDMLMAVPRMSGDDPLSDRMPTMVDAAAIAFNQKRW